MTEKREKQTDENRADGTRTENNTEAYIHSEGQGETAEQALETYLETLNQAGRKLREQGETEPELNRGRV